MPILLDVAKIMQIMNTSKQKREILCLFIENVYICSKIFANGQGQRHITYL